MGDSEDRARGGSVTPMARRALALAFVLTAACGQREEEMGKQEALRDKAARDAAARAAVPPAPPPPPPATPGEPRDTWAGTRVGDWATWEIRVDGSETVTRLTWRATKVDGPRVEYDVESRTTGPDGKVVASQEVRSVHGGGFDAVRPRGTTPKHFVVGAVRLEAVHHEYDAPNGKVSVWTSGDVPFHGLVESKGGGVEQTLVAFERGPERR
jgi:hypothetical protein